MMQTVYIGHVLQKGMLLHSVEEGRNVRCVAGLNQFLLDFCLVNARKIIQLPPLDDWTRSAENPSYWSVTLTELNLTISLHSTLVNFS
jgi:hypothetical protein